MSDKIILDELEEFEEILGECENCGCELTESNIYPKGNKQLCKACAKKGKKKKKLSKPKLIAIISAASVFVLTAIILLCYFTIPVSVKVEDAKEGALLALSKTKDRDVLTEEITGVLNGIKMMERKYAFNGYESAWWHESYLEDGYMDDHGYYVSQADRKVYRWNESKRDGKIEKDMDFERGTIADCDEWNVYIREYCWEDDFHYEEMISEATFKKAYKKGGVTTILGTLYVDDWMGMCEITIKFENDFIKKIEMTSETDEGEAIVTFTFNKKYEDLDLKKEEFEEGIVNF